MLFPSAIREQYAAQLLKMADVDGQLRPFELDVDEFDRLCQAYKQIIEQQPNLENYDPYSKGGIQDILFAEGLNDNKLL